MSFDYWRHSVRGWLFHFIGRNESAFEEYSTAYALNPSATNWPAISVSLPPNRTGCPMAPTGLKKLPASDPENAETWFNLGFALSATASHRKP